jgi:S1-C subfamily serine protease
VRRALACIAAAALVAGCGGGGKTTTITKTVQAVKPAAGGSGTPSAFDPEAIYKTEAPGVVTLVALSGGSQNAFGSPSEALGSGFLVDADGYIATNAHVITNDSGTAAQQVYAEFADGNRLPARIVGTDPDSDIGLVKVDPSKLRGPGAKVQPLPFGSTSELRVGDPVVAIGSPFGEQQSLSTGVVSALNRDIESLTNFAIGNAIQTDAAINHGNSGGPLLDGAGKVIGVNSQIRSTGGGGEGVGFAIPVETVKRSVAQLRAKGRVDYAYLGISSVTLYPQLAQRLGLNVLNGALVDRTVAGGPAAKAGLHGADSHITFQGIPKIPVGGDVIVAVDGKKLGGAQDVSDLIGVHSPGDVVKLRVIRNHASRTIDVTLGKRPERGD